MISLAAENAIILGAAPRSIGFVVIHTEGDGVNNDTSAATIRRIHQNERKFSDIGYNLWFRMNGLVEMGRPWGRVPAGATGFNTPALHFGFAGDGNIRDFTLAQYDALFDVVWLLKVQPWFKVTDAHFIGHREVVRFGAPDPKKTCPGKRVDMDRIRAMIGESR